MTPINYLTFSLLPPEINEAAETLHMFFEKQGMREWQYSHVADRRLVNKLETDIAELNERLIERQETLMAAIVDLKKATQLLTRCYNAATSLDVRRYTRGQVEIDLYEDVQNFLKTQPSYYC